YGEGALAVVARLGVGVEADRTHPEVAEHRRDELLRVGVVGILDQIGLSTRCHATLPLARARHVSEYVKVCVKSTEYRTSRDGSVSRPCDAGRRRRSARVPQARRDRVQRELDAACQPLVVVAGTAPPEQL